MLRFDDRSRLYRRLACLARIDFSIHRTHVASTRLLLLRGGGGVDSNGGSSGKNEVLETVSPACLRFALCSQVRRIPDLTPIAAKVRA